MGQNAFLERYEKPNYRLHVVIFLLLVGGSLYLSTQVEQSRDKANVPALKNPVPIESVTLNDASRETRIKPAIQPAVTSDPRQSPFTNETANRDTAQAQTNDQQPAKADTADQTKATFAGLQESADKKLPEKRDSSNALDAVYDEQQDRFLQTLAKSAVTESKESVEVKKLRQAILQDKPLKPNASAEQGKPSKLKHNNQQVAKAGDKDWQSGPVTKTAKHKLQRKQASSKDNKVVRVAAHESRSTLNNPQAPQLTKRELDKILSRFTRSYNNGNINQLMSLFHDTAVTNDRSNKRGIEADYEELFNNTLSRNLMIKKIDWRVRKGKAEGAAIFEVIVQPKNGEQPSHYRGNIKIVAEKKSQGIYITRLLHDVDQ